MPTNDTGPRKIIPVAGDGNRAAKGVVQPVTGLETRACIMCKSFDKDDRKLTEYLRARGMTINIDGSFETPIAKDLPGMVSMKLDIHDCGFCRFWCYPVEMLATCEKWVLRRSLEGLVK